MFRTRPKNAKKVTRKAFDEMMARKNNNNRRPRNNSAMQNRSNRNKNINGEVISPGVAKKTVNEILSAYFPKDIAKKATDFGYEIYKQTKAEDVKYWVKIIVLLFLIYIGQPAGLVNNMLDVWGGDLVRYAREVEPVPASFWLKFPKFFGFTVEEYKPSQVENLMRRFGPYSKIPALFVKKGLVGPEETLSIVALLFSFLLYVYIYTGEKEKVKSYAYNIGAVFGQATKWYAQTTLKFQAKRAQVKWGAAATVLGSVISGTPAQELTANRLQGS